MKSDSKHRTQNIKTQPTSNIKIVTSNKYAKLTTEPVQELQFHLHDEQPQSLNAKRKLQEFSVSFHDQKVINPNNRSRHTVNLLKKKTIKDTQQDADNFGWIGYEFTTKGNLQSKDRQKKRPQIGKRMYSAPRHSMVKTVSIKQTNNQKSQLSLIPSPQKKLNLTFNNIMLKQMQIIREQQISQEIIKKVKNAQSKRPNSSSYYTTSHKIFSLFEKNKNTGNDSNQVMRIHSLKDSQEKSNAPLTIKDRQMLLKTTLFNNFYDNNKKKLSTKNTKTSFSGNFIFQTNKEISLDSKYKNFHHQRTYSQPVKNESGRDKNNERLTLSNRKFKVMSDKKSRNKWGHKRNQSRESFNQLDQQGFDMKNLRIGQQSRRESGRDQRQSQNNSTSRKNNQKIGVPGPSNLEQDFSLLISLLKNESQHIFGGQLHNYLTQMKNNYQYNYYMSSAINKKNTNRQSFNNSMRIPKTKKEKAPNIPNHFIQGMLGSEQVVNKVPLRQDYAPLSASKCKTKVKNFLISSGDLI